MKQYSLNILGKIIFLICHVPHLSFTTLGVNFFFSTLNSLLCLTISLQLMVDVLDIKRLSNGVVSWKVSQFINANQTLFVTQLPTILCNNIWYISLSFGLAVMWVVNGECVAIFYCIYIYNASKHWNYVVQ
jgi:hypothetical protein